MSIAEMAKRCKTLDRRLIYGETDRSGGPSIHVQDTMIPKFITVSTSNPPSRPDLL